MLIRDDIPAYLKRILLFVFVSISFLLEYSTSLLPSFAGVKMNILLPFVVAVGIFEKETTGFVFGLIAGCLADMTSVYSDGLNTFYFAVAGCTAGLLMHYIMRTTFLSSVIVNGVLCFIYNAGCWIVNVLIPVGDNGAKVFFVKYVPSFLISSVIFSLSFVTVKYIRKFTFEIEKKYFG